LPQPDNSAWFGQANPFSRNSTFNQIEFVARQVLNRAATTTLVKVVKVTNAGELSPVGYVDVQPMDNQIDGRGRATPHGVIHNIPYLRVQGGANAVIIDPQPGDIGMASFASHDISTVKRTRQVSNPGSRRRFDWSDGLYHGGMLNGAPSQVVRFAADGVHIETPNKVAINAGGDVTIFTNGDFTVQSNNFVIDGTGNTLAQGLIAATGAVVAGQGTPDQVNLQTHHHPTNGAPPTPGS